MIYEKTSHGYEGRQETSYLGEIVLWQQRYQDTINQATLKFSKKDIRFRWTINEKKNTECFTIFYQHGIININTLYKFMNPSHFSTSKLKQLTFRQICLTFADFLADLHFSLTFADFCGYQKPCTKFVLQLELELYVLLKRQ